MKNLQRKIIAATMITLSILMHRVIAADEQLYDVVSTALKEAKKENPFSEEALKEVKLQVVSIARSAGCTITDLIILNSFATRIQGSFKSKATNILSDFGKEFFENILPRHEDSIIELMQQPEFLPIQDIITEHFGNLPQIIGSSKETISTVNQNGFFEEKVTKLTNLINGCEGYLHKLAGLFFALGAYAESFSKKAKTPAYEKLFSDIKLAITNSAAKHLDLGDINHIERFLSSDAYKKLITRYDDLTILVINSLRPGFYQNTAKSLWDKAKSFVGSVAASVVA